METTRREFIRAGAAAGAAFGLGIAPHAVRTHALTPHATAPSDGAAPRRIRLLILGGTGFIGPYQVRYAVERGHEVTIFNRGRSAPGAFTGVEEVIGDVQ